MNAYKLPKTRCPACQYVVDAATHVGDGDNRPSEDDFSVCVNCGAISRYNADMQLRACDAFEIEVLPLEQRIQINTASRLCREGKFKKKAST